MTAFPARAILRFQSPDRPGILGALLPELVRAGWDIRDAKIFGDPDTGLFFVRVELSSTTSAVEELRTMVLPLAQRLDIACEIYNADMPMRVVVAVSKFEHCLADLLHKAQVGTLPVTIAAVVSNHEDARRLAQWYDVPFEHAPVSAASRGDQERALLDLMEQTGAELFVLARYMQVLSDDLARRLFGRCINIHHSFLPSFKGAKPYHQAHARGVKQIGATAHFVTSDLDEGPIIEQDVRRITHAHTAQDMLEIGRDVEAAVLTRAVRWYAERRVFENGRRTVVLQ